MKHKYGIWIFSICLDHFCGLIKTKWTCFFKTKDKSKRKSDILSWSHLTIDPRTPNKEFVLFVQCCKKWDLIKEYAFSIAGPRLLLAGCGKKVALLPPIVRGGMINYLTPGWRLASPSFFLFWPNLNNIEDQIYKI